MRPALRVGTEALLRPAHVAVFALVCGMACGPLLPKRALLAAVAGLAAAAVAVGRSPAADAELESAARRRTAARVVSGAAVLVLAGATFSHARVAALERTTLTSEIGHVLTTGVVLRDAPRRSKFGGWSGIASLRGEPVLLRVNAGSDALPPTGSILEVTGALGPPDDFALRRHAHAVLRTRQAAVTGRRGGIPGALDGVRTRAETALDRGLPPAAAGLMRGMVLGQDSALPDATRDAFRAAGLSHLVAASGTNVVLLAALALAVGAALGLGLDGRLWLTLALIAIYVPLAGGGASIQRAGVMGAAAVAAGLAGRPSSRWYALGLAAVVTLALDPRATGEPGWQLSFVAVVSLLLLAPRWRRGLVGIGLPEGLADVTAMTAAATFATAPVIAAHFGQASLVSVPANLAAAPAVAPIMWLGIVAAAVGQLAPLGGPVESISGLLVDGLDAAAGFPLGYLAWVARVAAAAPGAVVHVGPWVVLVAVSAALLLLASRRLRRHGPVLAVVVSAAWLGLSPPGARPPGHPLGLRVTFLDVGQGDATLIQDGERAVLVDTGLPDAGVVARLRRAGVGRLDLLVVTHVDADHAGGAASVLAAVPVGLVLDGRDGVVSPDGAALADAARRRRVRLITPDAGQLLRVGGLALHVLWPRAEPAARHAGGATNDRAIVLEAESRGARVLLPADAESNVLAGLDLRPVDVLKVSHHGSDDPGLAALLTRLRPRVAAIEVGRGNTYGHPTASTLTTLTAARVPVVVRTDRDGTVRLDFEPSGRWQVRAHV